MVAGELKNQNISGPAAAGESPRAPGRLTYGEFGDSLVASTDAFSA